MDRWILACSQSLIKFVREEMKGKEYSVITFSLQSQMIFTLKLHYLVYHLYTVVPRLLSMIEQLTNWYVRFNRKRLKGENGSEDAVNALNALYEVLFTLSRSMVKYFNFLIST